MVGYTVRIPYQMSSSPVKWYGLLTYHDSEQTVDYLRLYSRGYRLDRNLEADCPLEDVLVLCRDKFDWLIATGGTEVSCVKNSNRISKHCVVLRNATPQQRLVWAECDWKSKLNLIKEFDKPITDCAIVERCSFNTEIERLKRLRKQAKQRIRMLRDMQ